MPDDKDLGQSQQSEPLQGSSSDDFPYEETTTRIRKSDDGVDYPKPRDVPKETKSSE